MPTLRQRLQSLKLRLSQLFDLYGPVALGVWFAIFGLVLLGFYTAMSMGFQVGEDKAAGVATLAAAYGATQLTKPLRIVATLAATPLVARLLGRSVPAAPAEPPDQHS